ncbi:MAG: Na+/H+ antiporter NhaA [Candidatus Kariarchaeaceae archaeon]|jgi:NhaA family Na+:H+ antiporter
MANPMVSPFPTKRDAPISRLISPFQKFVKYEASSGIILIIAVAVALLWANLSQQTYNGVWSAYLTISVGGFELSKPLTLWINDLLMAIFFLLVGLEVKREVLVGELRYFKSALLPISAAIGGIAVPALLYVMINLGNPEFLKGWAIPAATDIAFALGILYLLGDRVPASARVFLATLAIIDDIAAILIIAIFYSGTINMSYILLAAVAFILLITLNLLNVRRILPYMLFGSVMWYGFFGSGIHATIAGVFLAATIPATIKMDHVEFRDKSNMLISELIKITDDENVSSEELAIYMDTISELEYATQAVSSPLQRLEHSLAPYVIFLIMPIFALANAGVLFSTETVSQVTSPVSLGIILGLLVGKPVGVFLFSFISVRMGLANLQSELSWANILGLGFLAGIGFTMSTFISSLAFEFEPAILDVTKIAILLASFLAGILGYSLLRRSTGEASSQSVNQKPPYEEAIPISS